MLLPVTFAKRFRNYLIKHRSRVRNDHEALMWEQNFIDLQGQEFDCRMGYRSGIRHANPNALFRCPIWNHENGLSCTVANSAQVGFQENAKMQCCAVQSSDDSPKLIYAKLAEGHKKPGHTRVVKCSLWIKHLWSLWNRLTTIGGVLVFRFGTIYSTKVNMIQSTRLYAELGHVG